MGIIWSRFRKKESTKEKLQKIQEEITSLEEHREHTEQRRKKLVGSLIAYSIFFSLIAAIICYFYYLPPTLEERLLYATSFAGFLILIYIIKKLLTCYYRWKVRRNENKLSALKEKKEDILNQVMETETYKVTKEILEIYAPEQIRKVSMTIKSPITTPVIGSQRMPLAQSGELRRRIISPQTSQAFSQRPIHTPAHPGGMSASMTYGRPIGTPRPQQVIRPNVSTPSSLQGPRVRFSSVSPMNALPYARSDGNVGLVSNNGGGEPPGPPMPRPILPRERGILDRFVEYLVGDGPSNRYALVCRQCESHNGMALKDEFPYIAFRCAYCFYWNPARKQKPAAPRLEPIQQRSAELSRRMLDKEEESSSEEEEDGSEESDSSSASNPSSGDTEEGSLEGCSDTPTHIEGEGAKVETLKGGSLKKVEDIQLAKQELQVQPESHASEKEIEPSSEKETGQSSKKETGQSSEKETGPSSEKETGPSSESVQSIEADDVQPQLDVKGTEEKTP